MNCYSRSKKERHWARSHGVSVDYCITVGEVAFICDHTKTSLQASAAEGSGLDSDAPGNLLKGNSVKV